MILSGNSFWYLAAKYRTGATDTYASTYIGYVEWLVPMTLTGRGYVMVHDTGVPLNAVCTFFVHRRLQRLTGGLMDPSCSEDSRWRCPHAKQSKHIQSLR